MSVTFLTNEDKALLDASIQQNKTDIVKNTTGIAALTKEIKEETNRAKAEEARIEALFTADVSESVNSWLDEHPEATTTVKDGSLETTKLSDDAKLLTVKDYVTPQMFGAKGDNVNDDTVAFQNAINSGIKVYVPKGIYKISKTLVIPAEPNDIMGRNRVCIVGEYGETMINFVGGGNVISNSGELYMENIRIESQFQNGNGIYTSGRIKMYHCQSNGNGENGLLFDDSVHISHCIIEDCTFYANRKNGIECTAYEDAQKNNILIINTYALGNGSSEDKTVAQNDGNGCGILLRGIVNINMYNCVMQDNHGAGLLLKNNDYFGVLSTAIIGNYFEGNRLAHIYLDNGPESTTYRDIVIHGNYYTIYPAEHPEEYVNSLFALSTKTVVRNPASLVSSIVDDTHYGKNNDIYDYVKIVEMDTENIAPSANVVIPFADIQKHVPGGKIKCFVPTINRGSESSFDVAIRCVQGSSGYIAIRNNFAYEQTAKINVAIFYHY